MTRENKMKVLSILEKDVCTVELRPVINGFVRVDCIALTEAPHRAIDSLIGNGYIVSLSNGKLIVDTL